MSALPVHDERSGDWAALVAAAVARDHCPGTPADKQARAIASDPYLWAHPERIAQADAHQSRRPGSCQHDHDRTLPCDCPPEPAALADLWAGKARMAAARAAAGVALDDLDRQALALDRGARPS